jgi:long-chain acyl-CoA synthetase
MATFRFTSGTSGQIKAACFDHASLRWMAESVCVVMNSWRAIDAELSYLSYLPMNHVVEGILTGYSAYYSSAAFNIFFLEDIKGLPNALRMVRPHIFFSVPRFYEKVWQAFGQRRLSRAYLDSGEGVRRRLLGRFLRWVLLRRAGLDRCAQLVVGSAPCGDGLLRSFQELGIEIYNAYGLTEAPLVTMNRPGRNRVGTVGEPLAETGLTVDDDGELLVSGPQVSQGYLDGDTSALYESRVLHTGDLGYLTQEGRLVLRGRKKEIIVTSYGENLDPVKIEAMLRSISGVNEALVVGDGRPYCAAIVWMDGDALGGDSMASVERAIVELNRTLSHPEQVKRWAFLRGQPSIEKGEMTANLKLKRGEVTSRLSDTIEDLYSGRPPLSSEVVRMGGAH